MLVDRWHVGFVDIGGGQGLRAAAMVLCSRRTLGNPR
jgi:hypothetical protein